MHPAPKVPVGHFGEGESCEQVAKVGEVLDGDGGVLPARPGFPAYGQFSMTIDRFPQASFTIDPPRLARDSGSRGREHDSSLRRGFPRLCIDTHEIAEVARKIEHESGTDHASRERRAPPRLTTGIPSAKQARTVLATSRALRGKLTPIRTER